MLRCVSLLVLASSIGLAACSGDPEPTPAIPAPTPPVEADTPLGPEPREEESQIPEDSVVVPDIPPASPTPPAAIPDRPSTPEASTPRPERPSAPVPTDPDPQPPTTPARVDRTAVEAFWTRFQSALRARDASAIDDFLHTTVRVSGQAYDRDGPQVQEVVRQFAENPDLTEAYLDTSADELVVTAGRATFSSIARYTLVDEAYEVTVSGVLREVQPGTWRIVELASEPR